MLLRFFLFILLLYFTACSDSSSSSSDNSFIEPDFSKSYDLVNKSYSFSHSSLNEIYSPADSDCIAIYFNGDISEESYEGFAVKDAHEAVPDFNLKIYKKSVDSHFTIKIRKNNVIETLSDENDSVTITPLDENRYQCSFKTDLVGSSFTILTSDSIVAQKY